MLCWHLKLQILYTIFSGALESSCHFMSCIAFCFMTVFCGGGPGRFIGLSCRFPVACSFSWGCCSSGLGESIVTCGRAPTCVAWQFSVMVVVVGVILVLAVSLLAGVQLILVLASPSPQLHAVLAVGLAVTVA